MPWVRSSEQTNGYGNAPVANHTLIVKDLQVLVINLEFTSLYRPSDNNSRSLQTTTLISLRRRTVSSYPNAGKWAYRYHHIFCDVKQTQAVILGGTYFAPSFPKLLVGLPAAVLRLQGDSVRRAVYTYPMDRLFFTTYRQ